MTYTVVVIGATGGLGAAIAQAYARKGARIVLIARREERLHALAESIGRADTLTLGADITQPEDLSRAAHTIQARFGRIDVVINAAGVDVRGAFTNHTVEESRQLVEVNLLGAIWITRAFLPGMLEQKSGVIVHVGGFADGRLAFPFYTVDSAARAGVRGFVDAINREYENSGVTVTYFCPAPADTEAERPFHPIWRAMGTPIVTPEQVAAALIKTVDQRRRVAMMGAGTRVFAWLNSVSSWLADVLLMRRYREILREHLG